MIMIQKRFWCELLKLVDSLIVFSNTTIVHLTCSVFKNEVVNQDVSTAV